MKQVRLILVGTLTAVGLGGFLFAQHLRPTATVSNAPGDSATISHGNTRSPVDLFRELLAATPEERKLMLSNRPPAVERRIQAKLREYESLKPNERELRLRVTELQWYLSPLMSSPATNRAAQLALIPEKDRAMVADRLQEWDKLSPAVQQELLENEAAIRYFSERDPGLRNYLQPEIISPARFKKLQAGIRQWQSLTEAQREKITERFKQFFELTPQEKEKTLSSLSEPERRQIEKTLKTFENLPAAQRDQCIRSFEKFASLSLEERQQFLRNADRWRQMKPDERQAWRELVEKLPPGIRRPPLPPALARLRRPPVVATNELTNAVNQLPTK